MVISDFTSKIVFLDTAPLIYFIEGHSVYQSFLKPLFEANDNGDFIFVTSSITLLEVLVNPLKDGKLQLVSQYKGILSSASHIEI